MTAEEITAYRKAYFDELCKQSEGGTWNMPRGEVVETLRHTAFDSPDSDIEALALYYETPAEAAMAELQ